MTAGWFGEMKKRRVFRAVIGYSIVSFAILQVIEPIMHGLGLPEWVLAVTVIALGLGFPITLVLAWVFDVNAGRVETTGPRPPARLLILLIALGVVLGVPGVGWYLVLRPSARAPSAGKDLRAALDTLSPASDPRAAPSIAVLPLVNLSRDPDQEYFADGLAEELLNLLAKVPGLRVAARTSAFAFKGKSVKVSEIGRELGVATVLEGSVRKSGDQIRISTQLINASDGYHLWSETYDRKLTDIFAVQDEIARAVVSALKLKLLPGQEPGTGEQRTASTEAYLHYLEGRKLLADFTQDNYLRAQAAFRRALELDSGFAPAWSGLGYARYTTGTLFDNSGESAAKGLEEVERSIALGPGLAEAYVARGLIRLRGGFDWKGGRADLDRALALSPGDPSALESYGYLLQAWRGLLKEGAATLQRALARDPLNASLVHTLGCIYLFGGDLTRARQTFDRELALRPRLTSQDIWPIYLLLLEGRQQEALDASNRLDAEAWKLAGLALSFRALGREKESLAALDLLRGPRFGGFLVQVAQVHAFRGEKDSAFEWLDRAYANRDAGMMRLKVDPLLRKLDGDPRYTALLKKMDLPADEGG